MTYLNQTTKRKMENIKLSMSAKAKQAAKEMINSIKKGWKPDPQTPHLIYDRTFNPHFRMFIRLSLVNGMWHKTLANGAKLYKFFSIDVENDVVDPSLKLYSVTILSFMASFAWVPKPSKK